MEDLGLVDLTDADVRYTQSQTPPPLPSFGASATQEEESPSLFGAVAPAISGQIETVGLAADTIPGTLPSLALDALPRGGGSFGASQFGASSNALSALANAYFRDDAEQMKQESQQKFVEGLPAIVKERERYAKAVQALDDSPIKQFAAETAAGISGSATSLLPLIGGGIAAGITKNPAVAGATTAALATVPAAQAYANAFVTAKENGRTEITKSKMFL
jgi:hypothetical protein